MSPSGAARAATSTPAIDEPTRAWLLDPASPTTRRLAIARLALEDDGDPHPTADEPWIRTLLGGAPDDETAALHPYHKWRGVHWRLVALAELDADVTEPAIAAAVAEGFDRVSAWVSGTNRIRASRVDRRSVATAGSTRSWVTGLPYGALSGSGKTITTKAKAGSDCARTGDGGHVVPGLLRPEKVARVEEREEDSARDLARYLDWSPKRAADNFVTGAIEHSGSHADNATALIADLPAGPR